MKVASDWSSSLGTEAASSSLGAGDGSGDGSGDAPNGDDGTDESGVSDTGASGDGGGAVTGRRLRGSRGAAAAASNAFSRHGSRASAASSAFDESAARRTARSIAGVAAPEERLYWGVMEQYSLLHEPNASLRGHPFVGFGFRPAKRACADRRGGEGPFSFAKGPLHALSAPLAAQLVAARPFEEYVARVRAHPDEEDGAAAHYFEDAYTGWAVSKFARGDNLTVVHAGQFLYWDQWGSHYQGPRRGTVIFHARLKNGGVMRRADDMTAFARTQHCAPRRIDLPCYEPGLAYTACNGAQWRVCYANPAAFEPPGCDARAICANFTCAPPKEAARK